ncbi:MAG: RagB/SusD family nutrient uptake outer membrane protein [Bacteroidales bacterium]|nr:RagB/SusD family nutrient uptake outer membrane protein [Bacteroidales bacterium]MDD2425201.1 RagB/SusD family nutrient uptake outer membrane protein [Bacteroidales bacterium]MDD3989055.1 RagB/SusD family nutrient uptake outer membrane protein [Bacteroidales bacterium]MDD4638146.1 RagB/SusD family nutrient uptake outer membrane protein [Bacteroidales bacterium]
MIKIFRISLMVSLVLFCSCSKDYLDTKPTNASDTPSIFESIENVKGAINGLSKLMTIQYLESQGFNGEGTIKMYYGNYPGNHFSMNLPGWSVIINGEYREMISSIYLYYPWFYYYKIIGNANTVITHIDNVDCLQEEKDFAKAQALTFRAYAYFMLSQLYCARWMDSNNGASSGLVLRLDESSGEMPLSTLGDVYSRIYTDLDDAIALYTSSGGSRLENFEADINVAYAIYARAALTRRDYSTALDMAVDARDGYPLMSSSDYTDGFYSPTIEWIWSSFGGSDEQLHYYSFLAFMAYNSNASIVRIYPRCISKELFDKIPATDIRKSLFLNPQGYSYNQSTGLAGSALKAKAFELFRDIYPTSNVYAYMQFKFEAEDLPGVGYIPHFRSSEMYLTEAEACYFLNDIPGAQQALNTLNAARDPGYTCTSTGPALLEEIKMYRALELWGEGFDWFDLKRWGDSISRKSFSNGGNFISVLAITRGPEHGNNWIWKIPQKETDYNPLVE